MLGTPTAIIINDLAILGVGTLFGWILCVVRGHYAWSRMRDLAESDPNLQKIRDLNGMSDRHVLSFSHDIDHLPR